MLERMRVLRESAALIGQRDVNTRSQLVESRILSRFSVEEENALSPFKNGLKLVG